MDKRPATVHDYDALRDTHLKRFFASESMQRHMSHAAALDRISTRRNPWNDAIEFLMEAGSAYNVGSIFNSNDEFLGGGAGGGGKRSNSATGGGKKQQHRPAPPSASAAAGSASRRPGTGQHQRASSARGKQQQPERVDPSKLPPLPRFNAALRNIRRFDDEVNRVIHEGSRTENDEKEQERWNRMQQRIKVERMLREANSPKIGRRTAAQHEESAERRRQKEEEDEYKMQRGDGDDDDDYDEKYHSSSYDEERAMDARGKFFYPQKRGGGTRSLSLSLDSRRKKQQQEQQDDDEENNNDADEFQALTPSRPEKIPGWVTFAITRFQANCIGWVVRNKLQRSRDAVTKLQRAFRNHLAARGVSLAVRIIQRAGRALRIRHRLYLLAERHRLWQDANDEMLLLHDLCQNLHRAAGGVARLPVLEAHAREKLVAEEIKAEKVQGFEVTAGELRRRALLTCVAPKGKLRRESFRRLLDDEEDESNPPMAKDMKPMDTPAALVPALQEIEEEEPRKRVEEDEDEMKSPASNGGGGDGEADNKKDDADVSAPQQDNAAAAAAASSSSPASSIISSTASTPNKADNNNNVVVVASSSSAVDDSVVVVEQDDQDAKEDAEAKRLADDEARLTAADDDGEDPDTTIRPVAGGGGDDDDDDEEEL